ncbi:MAG: Protoheme farnesyltransferase [Candidatus Saccharibacteria bacterium]|nr:Protoheme farnesyltransferase [Candidatus Saccharibacteria bacterium]
MSTSTSVAKTPFYAQLSLAKTYYALTKPGIIYGNLLTATAGFLLASAHGVQFGLLLATLAGTALVIAAGCVTNNFTDRELDKKMKRTSERALVLKTISATSALIYAGVLGIAGLTILALLTNWLVVLIGLIGFIDYVVFYALAKRTSEHGTLVGSISGATPILAGYVAASGRLDVGAWLVFLILAAWQMPHFYSIAMYRRDEYKAAGVPVLSVVKGMQVAKNQTLLYIVVFTVAASLLTVYGYTGYLYLTVVLALGVYWLAKGLKTYSTNPAKWGRQMFLFSLVVLLVTCVMLSVGSRLP